MSSAPAPITIYANVVLLTYARPANALCTALFQQVSQVYDASIYSRVYCFEFRVRVRGMAGLGSRSRWIAGAAAVTCTTIQKWVLHKSYE